MKFMNLTPHPVVLSRGDLQVTFAKEIGSPVARVEHYIEEHQIKCEVAPGMVLSMPVNVVCRTEIIGLPEPQEGVMYIVSSMVAQHVERADVISPITDATCERDAQGRVISVKGFQTFSKVPSFMEEHFKQISKASTRRAVATTIK